MLACKTYLSFVVTVAFKFTECHFFVYKFKYGKLGKHVLSGNRSIFMKYEKLTSKYTLTNTKCNAY